MLKENDQINQSMLEMRSELTHSQDTVKKLQHCLSLKAKENEGLKLKIRDLQDYKEKFESLSQSKVQKQEN